MKGRRLARLAVAGQLDAGLSSLATFGLQVYTARVFTPAQLGAYALVFAAFLTVSRIPTEVAYKPIEVISVDSEPDLRLAAIRSSLRPGLTVGLVVAPAVVLGGLPVLGEIQIRSWWALVGSAAVVTVLSPLQDHLRRLFHVAERSTWAVRMAVIQVFGVIGGALLARTISPILVPFGALAVANSASIVWGIVRVLNSASGLDDLQISVSTRRHLARWLLATGVATSGFAYLGATILSYLLGFAALGHVEAARVAARPIQVVAQGLASVVGPRSMAAAARRKSGETLEWRRRFALMLALVAGPYVLLTAFEASFNPMSRLIPVAYVVPGLVLGMVVSYWLQATNLPLESEILGLRAARSLATIALIAGFIEAVGNLSAPLALEYAAPISVMVAALVRKGLYRRLIRNILR